jgi:hypothetical protein
MPFILKKKKKKTAGNNNFKEARFVYYNQFPNYMKQDNKHSNP